MRKAELRSMLEPFLPRAEGAIRPEELVQLLQAGRVSVVDTREVPVFNRAHITTAINLPLEEIETRLAVYADLEEKKKQWPEDLRGARVVQTPSLLGIRQTRFFYG